MIGDKFTDLQCGWSAGVRQSLLVRTGYGEAVVRERATELDRAIVVGDLTEAVEWVLKQLNPASSVVPVASENQGS
jgi:histidinol phosphatase-like enzyme